MTEQQMEAKVLAVLARFSAAKHQTVKSEVLGAGDYTLVAATEFDSLIDRLVLNGSLERDQAHGWLRLPSASKPSQPPGRSRPGARLRSGARA